MDFDMVNKTDTFRGLLKIDKKKLNEDLAKYPDQSYVLGMKIEKLNDKIVELSTQLKANQALIAASLRNKQTRGAKASTETAIKDRVAAHPEIREIIEEIDKYEKMKRLAKLKKATLKEKFESMVQIGHNVRSEREAYNNNGKKI